MSSIGLFGGSFDPVHIGHLITASAVICEFSLEKILFIPNYASPFKVDSTLTPVVDRIKMLELSIENNSFFELSLFETEKQRPVYTYETIEHYKAIYPDKDLFLIMGSDSYSSIDRWKNSDIIKGNANIIVLKRGSEDLHPGENVFLSKNSPVIELSSTMIREMVSKNLDIKYLVNDAVRCYINDKGLYRQN